MAGKWIVVAGLLVSQPAWAQEIDAMPVRSWRPIPMTLALEAAQKAVSVCAAAKTGIVVAVFDYSYGLRVLLSSDGPVNYGAEEDARRNAEAALKSRTAAGGAVAFQRGETPRAVISVAGAWSKTLEHEDPALNLTCAQAGLDAIKDRL